MQTIQQPVPARESSSATSATIREAAVSKVQSGTDERIPSSAELEKFKKAQAALRNNPALAAELAGQLASLNDPLPDRLLGHVLWIQGSALSLAEQHSEAMKVLIHAEEVARRISDDSLLRRVLRYKAASAFECSKYSVGRDSAAEGIRLSEKMGDQSSYVAKLYSELAANESAMGNKQVAIESLLKAVEIAEQCGDKRARSRMLVNVATIMLELELYETAIDTFQRVLSVEGRGAPNLVMVAALRGLGDAEAAIKNFDVANEYLLQALELCEIPGTSRLEADIRISLGKLNVDKGNLPAARQYLRDAEEKFRELEQPDDASHVQQLLQAIDESPEIEERIALMQSNLRAAQKSGALEQQAVLHSQLAAAFRSTEGLEQATIHSLEAEKLEERLKDLGLNEQIASMLSEFSWKEKLRIIDDLKSDVSARNALLKAQKRWNATLIACIAVMVLILLSIVGLLVKYRRALNEVEVAKDSLRKQKRIQVDIERRLAEQQKSESLAVMASGIAHDFNNLLAGIAGLADLALVAPSHTQKDEFLGKITDASLHASTLTGQLMQFLGKPRMDAINCDVVAVLQSHQALLQSVARPNQLEITADVSPVVAVIDDNRLCQVLVNLVSNASEASEAEQKISVTVDAVNLSKVELSALSDTNVAMGDYCRIQVWDAGSGMSESTKDRLFDPYFSTKAMGRGLGLSSVIGIVRSCDGFVDVKSELGEGCCFSVYLKLAAHQVDASAPLQPDVPQPSGSHKIDHSRSLQVLLVDDEQMLLDMQTQYLTMAGLEVLTAKSAEEGLQLVNTHFSSLDCVVTDFCMSGKDGRWLAQQIRLKHPNIPVILCSGLVDGSLETDSDVISVLSKPFSSKTLEALIRDSVSQSDLVSTAG